MKIYAHVHNDASVVVLDNGQWRWLKEDRWTNCMGIDINRILTQAGYRECTFKQYTQCLKKS